MVHLSLSNNDVQKGERNFASRFVINAYGTSQSKVCHRPKQTPVHTNTHLPTHLPNHLTNYPHAESESLLRHLNPQLSITHLDDVDDVDVDGCLGSLARWLTGVLFDSAAQQLGIASMYDHIISYLQSYLNDTLSPWLPIQCERVLLASRSSPLLFFSRYAHPSSSAYNSHFRHLHTPLPPTVRSAVCSSRSTREAPGSQVTHATSF